MKKSLYSLALIALALPATAQNPAFEGLLSKGATRAATEADVIWTPPCVEAGHSYEYTFEAGCTGMSRVGLTDVNYNSTNGMKCHWIADTQGDQYYIQNPIPRTVIGSYIVGTLIEEDDLYVECQLPQWINARESTNTGVTVGIGTKTTNPDGMVFYEMVTDPELNKIRYTIDEEENFVLDIPEGYALCAFYTYLDEEPTDGLFAGSAVTHVIYKEPGRKTVPQIPEGVEPQEWGMLYSNGDKAHQITAAVDGDKVYLVGAMKDFPESCIIGTIEGDKVTFEANQYIGDTETTYEYLVFKHAQFLSTSDRGDVYDFTGELLPTMEAVWDATAQSISCSMEEAMFCNAGTDDLYYSAYYVGPMFIPSKGGAATPVNPEMVEVMDYMPEFGYGGFLADMPLIGTEGQVLDKEYYFYTVYFDGEPYTFSPELYPGVTEPMTMIPYDFEDGEAEDFRVEGSTHIICWRTAGFTEVGVQAIYTAGGEENRSEVVTYQLSSGVNGMELSKVVSIEYYDLNGVRVSNPGKGVYVKRTVTENGKVATSKYLVK